MDSSFPDSYFPWHELRLLCGKESRVLFKYVHISKFSARFKYSLSWFTWERVLRLEKIVLDYESIYLSIDVIDENSCWEKKSVRPQFSMRMTKLVVLLFYFYCHKYRLFNIFYSLNKFSRWWHAETVCPSINSMHVP